jgi:hypothetical protein
LPVSAMSDLHIAEKKNSGVRIFGCRLWPPRFPDLSTPDFFDGDFLKEEIYINKLTSLEDFNITSKKLLQELTKRLSGKMQNTFEKTGSLISRNYGTFSASVLK